MIANLTCKHGSQIFYRPFSKSNYKLVMFAESYREKYDITRDVHTMPSHLESVSIKDIAVVNHMPYIQLLVLLRGDGS